MINEEIMQNFRIEGRLISLEQKKIGNINKTYIAKYLQKGEEKRYLIQQINNYVFRNPYEVMKNITGVTSFIQKQMDKNHDTKHQVLQVIKTTENNDLLVSKNDKGEDEYYRVYNFIENSVCYNKTENIEIIRNAGKAFGNFQKLLNDYPMEELAETIKDFHNTKKRFENFEISIKNDIANRAKEIEKEIKFVLDRRDLCSLIVDKLANKEIPLRVTHNDTKVNNVMMNKETKDFLAVIDLDTVMPGSGLYDYGDGVRSAASTSVENETDLDKVFFKNELFESYTDGYMSEMAKYMTKEEIKLMGPAIRLITLELVIRFLDDYLNGDKYFRCDYEKHNLDRARNQIKLVQDIENKMDYINHFIEENYKKYNSYQ